MLAHDRVAAVYLLASKRYGTLYLGASIDLVRRTHQHRQGEGAVFTRKYGVTRLVWYELHELASMARAREAAIKKWRRDWKIALIEKDNPDWIDLWPVITGQYVPRPSFES